MEDVSDTENFSEGNKVVEGSKEIECIELDDEVIYLYVLTYIQQQFLFPLNKYYEMKSLHWINVFVYCTGRR